MDLAHPEYEVRLAARRLAIAALDRPHLLISNGRLPAVAGAAAVLWLCLVRQAIGLAWLLLPGMVFAVLAVLHQRVLDRMDRARRAERWYELGLARLDGRWFEHARDGAHLGQAHDYARDLDLFGPRSLFQLLNTTRTEAGETVLAGWLREGAAIDEVRARQAAVEELRSRLDLREQIAVTAAGVHASRTGALAMWAGAAQARYPPSAAWVFGGCAGVLLVLTAAAYAEIVPGSIVVGWLLVESAVVWAWRKAFHAVVGEIDRPAADLASVAALLAVVESARFEAPRLAALQAALDARGVHASRAVTRLGSLVSLLESSTHNLFFRPFTMALLVPQQIAVAIDRWHGRHGRSIGEWLRVVGELEAFGAISGYAYEHPADPFPDLVEGPAVFDAVGLGHPLLHEGTAVSNDLVLGREGPHVIVVSGSNMSGKSTLLRSVGINVVLALAGAPVRATRLRLSALVLGATLRIEDSIQDGRSQFYAEILRIRAIVDQARGPVPLLFLLDEILHGTNSYDRRVGAEAIVRALAATGAIGLVTTHDLALTEVPARLPVAAANTHFEDRLEDGRMVFDYRMRPGVVEHSNALALMRAVGLDV
ncbi:MAG: DNA mismatch repair protein MutS [Acidobacteriota bacterium]